MTAIMIEEGQTTILVVDDERAYVDAFETWLEGTYTVRTATDGTAALKKIDDAIDIVLLDRRMPGVSGDEVLTELRRSGNDCPVAMITAVEPEISIIELPFDEYLVKPVTKEQLLALIETLLVRATFDAEVKECYSLAAKKTALESSIDSVELDSSDEYERLCRRLEDAKIRADEALDDLVSAGEFAAAYYDIES